MKSFFFFSSTLCGMWRPPYYLSHLEEEENVQKKIIINSEGNFQVWASHQNASSACRWNFNRPIIFLWRLPWKWRVTFDCFGAIVLMCLPVLLGSPLYLLLWCYISMFTTYYTDPVFMLSSCTVDCYEPTNSTSIWWENSCSIIKPALCLKMHNVH